MNSFDDLNIQDLLNLSSQGPDLSFILQESIQNQDLDIQNQDDQENIIPDLVGKWMDEALQDTLHQTHESLFYEEQQDSLLLQVQDELGMHFDRDADLQENDKRSNKKKKKIVQEDLPPHLTVVFGSANIEYTKGNYNSAMQSLQKIIQECPTAYQPWAQLAMIHDELGNPVKALQTYLVAAHLTKQDGELWARLGNMSKSMGYMEQASYCWSKAIRANPEDCESIWERSVYCKDKGMFEKAIEGFKLILFHVPHYMPAIKELARIFLTLKDPQSALDGFEDAFYSNEFALMDSYETDLSNLNLSTSNLEEEIIGDYSLGALTKPSVIGFEELNMMCELYLDLGQYEKGIHIMNSCICKLKGLKQVNADNLITLQDIPIEILIKFGIFYLYLKETQVAKRYLELLETVSCTDYSELYYEVADAYIQNRIYATALTILDKLSRDLNVPETWSRMAVCYRALGDTDAAIHLYTSLLEVDSEDNETKFLLAQLYDEVGETVKAKELVDEVDAASKIEQIQALNPIPQSPQSPQDFSNESDDSSECQVMIKETKKTKDRSLLIAQEKARIQESCEMFDKIKGLYEKITNRLDDLISRVYSIVFINTHLGRKNVLYCSENSFLDFKIQKNFILQKKVKSLEDLENTWNPRKK